MKICAIYHVYFERLGLIEDWIIRKNHDLREIFLYENNSLPVPEEFDLLVLMGGPMSVNEEHIYPWLVQEKALIRESIRRGKGVLGICLGSQLIASALGSRVYAGKTREIGWYPVVFNRTPELLKLFRVLPEGMTVFHWHGETFDLPPGAVRLAQSTVTENQAFIYKNCVLGIQFHMEMKPESISLMINHAGHELVPGHFVQEAQELPAGLVHLPENRTMLESWLDLLEDQTRLNQIQAHVD
jgi:GMP synthase (glutamine-hydrolysing)